MKHGSSVQIFHSSRSRLLHQLWTLTLQQHTAVVFGRGTFIHKRQSISTSEMLINIYKYITYHRKHGIYHRLCLSAAFAKMATMGFPPIVLVRRGQHHPIAPLKSHYRSGTLNSNTVNSKFHLIRSFFEILATILSFHV